MKVIKKINNNVALCLDNNGHELVAFGNGIGFPKTPYELTDLSKVTRTFYGVDRSWIPMLETVDEEIFQACIQIVDYARQELGTGLAPNVVFTLADHISFAIERMRKGIEIKMPLYYDLAHLYEKEVAVGDYARKLIRTKLREYLPESETYAIALHLINAEEEPVESSSYDSEKVISQVTNIIEDCCGFQIAKEDFNYSRFVTHMQYLLKRKNRNVSVSSGNRQMFSEMKENFPQIYQCVEDIAKYFEDSLQWELSEEEKLYLMLHINRLCAREDCNH